MIKALSTAATGMAAQEANINNISNNIANVNTTGFKKGRTEFDDLLYQTIQAPGSRSSSTTKYNVGTQIGTGAKVSSIKKIHTQGQPIITKNPFDFMINGDGHFGVLTPENETLYTRDGSFNTDETGTLVTRQGYRVFPGIVFPPNTLSVNISEDGKVDAYLKGQIEPQTLGTIPLFTFSNPAGLSSIGGNFFRNTSSSGAPIQNIAGTENAGKIRQGNLEASNVSIMKEMTNMIKAQRAYEMNAKIMGVADQMLQTVNNIR